MTSNLVCLCWDARDPLRLARFWSQALGWEIYDETSEEIGLASTDGTRFRFLFLPVLNNKAGKKRLHLDLTSRSTEGQRASVRRLVDLGARHIDIGQGPDTDHRVLADPEGNEFCVVEPGNFVADGGFVGSITCDVPWVVMADPDGNELCVLTPR